MEGQFSEKASAALTKNFKKVHAQPKKVKDQAKKLLLELNLERLSGAVNKSQGLNLEVFFTIKTHKPDQPVRTIVSERNTWQHVVSGYLQKNLTGLQVEDPFKVKNSEDVIRFLREEVNPACTAFSIDVTDLCCSLPRNQLIKTIKDCIMENDELKFRNDSGVPVESFLELLVFYLNSTFVICDAQIMIQKRGVCIGSQVAPILSEIFLGTVDRALESVLAGTLIKCFRFVDDYLERISDVVTIQRQRFPSLRPLNERPSRQGSRALVNKAIKVQLDPGPTGVVAVARPSLAGGDNSDRGHPPPQV
ncbi:uncharacterized protein LOC142558587 [Dermacentor variabilis]|uniref:uncharacterized protein LOC142558587 n=1 Tax=Dermacentor variabilis TaxID=34621 RepID=UPI003F5B1E65